MQGETRKLATIRIVDEVLPIVNADAIELVRFGGWQCVSKKGEFKAGDKAVYFEIDSMLPEKDTRFAFLAKSGTKSVMGVNYYRLKTMRMRGELSQGLALPVSLFPELTDDVEDIDTVLGIIKYAPDMGKVRSADEKGSFPQFIRKTDAERIQNIRWSDLKKWIDDGIEFEVTVKLDGSSMTVYDHNGEKGVCSRNLELKLDQDNPFPNAARNYYLIGSDTEWHYMNIAIQGELIGPRIQGNYEQVHQNQFHVFSIWDITRQQYVASDFRHQVVDKLGLNHVPILHNVITLKDFVGKVDDEKEFRNAIMALAEGSSIYNPQREGIVLKSTDGSIAFKVISNSYLERKK